MSERKCKCGKDVYMVHTSSGLEYKCEDYPVCNFGSKPVDDLSTAEKLIAKISMWHHDRNLIEGSTDKDQFLKLMQEAGELSDHICKQEDIADDLGDMMVVMINIMVRNDLTIEDCLEKAWNDIKDRKGKMIDGIFVKEADLYANS